LGADDVEVAPLADRVGYDVAAAADPAGWHPIVLSASSLLSSFGSSGIIPKGVGWGREALPGVESVVLC
jgi:hypothetical protein